MVLHLPGDKSLSHRYLMLSLLARGTCEVTNLGSGLDIRSTLNCLQQVGLQSKTLDDRLILEPPARPVSPSIPLNCGNSGTSARLLSGLLSGQGLKFTLEGDASLSQRPMQRIIQPLSQMGVKFDRVDQNTLPLTLYPSPLAGISYTLPLASAQVKSSILLAGLGANGPTCLIEPIPTRNHTEILLQALGFDLQIKALEKATQITLRPDHSHFDFRVHIPADPSSAAFFAVLALHGTQPLVLEHILLNEGRLAWIFLLKRLGASIEIEPDKQILGENVGQIIIRPSKIKAFTISETDIAALIDELPVLSVLATQTEGVSVFRGAKELRFKESDRISAMALNLRRMGAEIEEFEDGLRIKGPVRLKKIRIETFNDHRIAMACSIAQKLFQHEPELDDPQCIAVSLPEFAQVLQRF